jgi:hypothetical protein
MKHMLYVLWYAALQVVPGAPAAVSIVFPDSCCSGVRAANW